MHGVVTISSVINYFKSQVWNLKTILKIQLTSEITKINTPIDNTDEKFKECDEILLDLLVHYIMNNIDIV